MASSGTDCRAREGDAIRTLQVVDPMGAIVISDDSACFVDPIADAERFVFALGGDLTRPLMRARRPFIYSFFPSVELQGVSSGSFLCRSLAGRPAEFGGRDVRDSVRSFGLIAPPDTGPGARWAKRMKRSARSTCNMSFTRARHDGEIDLTEAAVIIAKLKSSGVTTIVCACPPIPDSSSIAMLRAAAALQAYNPEWYFDSTSGMDVALWREEEPIGWGATFGASALWRQPSLREQYHYQAFLSEEPGETPNTLASFASYHAMLMAFVALQTAGPDPDAETIPAGLRTWNQLDRSNFFSPTGGFGPYGPNAVDPWAFVDTGMAWWWDVTGTGAGGSPGEGCIRAGHNGERFYPSEWPPEDGHLFAIGAPCNARTIDRGPII